MNEVMDTELATSQYFNQQVSLLGDRILGAMAVSADSTPDIIRSTDTVIDQYDGMSKTTHRYRTNTYSGSDVSVSREFTEVDGLLLPTNTDIVIFDANTKSNTNKLYELSTKTELPAQIGRLGLLAQFNATESVYSQPKERLEPVLSYSCSMFGTGILMRQSDLWTPQLLKKRTSIVAFTRQAEAGGQGTVGWFGSKNRSFTTHEINPDEAIRNAKRIINMAKSANIVKRILKQR